MKKIKATHPKSDLDLADLCSDCCPDLWYDHWPVGEGIMIILESLLDHIWIPTANLKRLSEHLAAVLTVF